MLLVLVLEALKGSHVINVFKFFAKLVDDVCTQVFNLFRSNEFEQFYDGWVKKIVSAIICLKSFYDGSE